MNASAFAQALVKKGERALASVEREFGLEGMAAAEAPSDVSKSKNEEKQTDFVRDGADENSLRPQPLSLEETQQKAAENWRLNYRDKRAEHSIRTDSSHANERPDKEKLQSERDAGLDLDPER